MLLKDMTKILGYYLAIFSSILLIPLLFSLTCDYFLDPSLNPQPNSTKAFLYTFLISVFLTAVFYWIGRRSLGKLYRREGVAIVVFIWLLSPVLGGLPFYLSGTLNNPFHAYYEAMSGLTTTGSTMIEAKQFGADGKEIPIETSFLGLEKVEYKYYGTIEPVKDSNGKVLLEGLEAIGYPLLFWRSFMQWIGGGGIMILFVAILPSLGVGGKILFQSEIAGPIKDAMTPRIKDTAVQLWKIYTALTLLEIFFLMVTNESMPFFDALTLSFATISTGGFSIHSDNIAYYHNTATELIIMVFMILGSVNFALYYYILKGKLYRLFDPELLLYLAIILFICLFSALMLVGTPFLPFGSEPGPLMSWPLALKEGSFQLISAISSTGFETSNFDLWPYEILTLMLIVMFIGGMAGSTAGGMKVIRLYALAKVGISKIESFFHPDAVKVLKIGKLTIGNETAIGVLTFFFIAISLSVGATFFYALDGIDPETAIGIVVSHVNNIGIAFRQAGPAHSMAFLSEFSVSLSCFLMVLGRLEFFAVLALLFPSFWSSKH